MRPHPLAFALVVAVACSACGQGILEERSDDGAAEADQGLASNWKWKVFRYGDDVWMRSIYAGVPQFEAMLGGAGALELFKDSQRQQNLLAPSFQGERTDRIIQGTMWMNNVLADDTSENSNPLHELRWNVTQAGDYAGQYSRTMAVETAGDVTDVYAMSDRQWFSGLNDDFNRTEPVATLTRYERLDRGVFKIRRVVRIPHLYKNGVEQPLLNVYFENWTPFLSSPTTFDGLAFKLASDGTPNWWFQAGYNIPYYPKIQDSQGYGVVFKVGAHSQSPVVGLVFSKEQPVIHSSGRPTCVAVSQLNSMGWSNPGEDHAMAVLPSINVNRAKGGTVLDVEIRVVPWQASNANFYNHLQNQVQQAAPFQVYEPGAALSNELAPIVARLESYLGNPNGWRTNHLAWFPGAVP